MPSAKGSDALDKIRSDELRRDVLQTAPEPQVVLLELDLPQPRITHGSRFRTIGDGSRGQISSPAGADSEKNSRIAETRRAITKIVGKPPEQFFSSSGTFVVNANGTQLQQLAELPFVHAIWPNTRR